jgi:hypothetical protein
MIKRYLDGGLIPFEVGIFCFDTLFSALFALLAAPVLLGPTLS